MKIQFDDPLFEAWTQRPILTIAEGGAEIGEIKATAARIPKGDRDAWVSRMDGDRRPSCTRRPMNAHKRACAHQRALPLSAGVDLLPQRLSAAARPADRSPGQVRLCTRGRGFCPRRRLFDPPITPAAIPFGRITLPGWFYSGGAGTRPLLICTNGYDETVQTMHYGCAAAAQCRG